MGTTPTVFVSFHRADQAWRERLVTHIRASRGQADVWDVTQVLPGGDPSSMVLEAIERASVALLLISPEYLVDEHILNRELSRLLERRQKEGLHVLLVLVKPCDVGAVAYLNGLEQFPRDGVALTLRDEGGADAQLAELAREVREILLKIAKAEERREVQARVEGTAAEYIRSSLDELRARERADRRLAHLWYTVGYVSLVAGVAVSAWRVYRLGTLPAGWATLVEFSVLGLVTIAMLLALAKYAFTLGKSFMVEALRHADRIHAISFGHFYLRAFGAQADWNNVKEALQHWNIDRGSSFMSQESSHFDPKLLEAATEIAKVLATKTGSK